MKVENANIPGLWNLICNHDDDKAFESLFHLLNNKLTRFCILYVHQKEIAEEIVSDIFVRCWLNRKTLTEIQNPASYLFVAVKNLSLNHLKKFSSIHLVELEDGNGAEMVDLNNPQKEFEKKELFLKMDEAIATLPRQCRIVFRLIKEDGMKYKEVAEILNISPRTVQTQLFRAIKKLSVVMYEYHKTDDRTGKNDITITLTVLFWALQLFFKSL